MLPRARLRASGVDLAAWQSGAPQTDLLAQLDVSPMADQLSLALTLITVARCLGDKGVCPVARAVGEAYLTREQLRLQQLELQPAGGASGYAW